MIAEDKLSFIPKKTLAKPAYKKSGPSLLILLSLGILIISGLLFGGAYLYRESKKERVKVLTESLKRAQDLLDPVFIKEVTELDRKIEESKKLLGNHSVVTPILSFLEGSTLENVRYTNFSFSFPDPKALGKLPTLTVNGLAKSYASLALQTQEFNKNENIENLAISNLSLGQAGRVNFTAIMEFNPAFFSYRPQQQ